MVKKLFLPFLLIGVALLIAGCSHSRATTALPTGTHVEATLSEATLPTQTAPPAEPTAAAPTAQPTEVASPTPPAVEDEPAPTSDSASISPSTEGSSTTTSDSEGNAAQTASQPAPDCLDKAAFSEDVTIPDGTLVKMGETFTKTWKIRNEGTCTWSGYSLVYAGGEAMNAPMTTPLQEIKPGRYANISIQLQAPQRGGSHTGYFKFQNASGQVFGVGASTQDLIWVQITVDYVAPTSTAQTNQTTSSPGSSSQGSTVLVSNPQTTTAQSGCEYTRNSDYESQLLALINDARSQNGLAPLSLDSRLSAAALAHSVDMACNDLVSHTGSDGSTWYDRASAQGFANSASARENVYVGNPAFGGDAQGAFTWWMNSQIHRDNILNPKVSVIGIGYAFTSTSTYGGHYTLVLARP